MKEVQTIIKNELGIIYLAATQEYLTKITWYKNDLPEFNKKIDVKESKILTMAEKQISEFLQKKRTSFDIPILAKGTAFQEKVWRALEQIPFGETRSYSDIAIEVKSPKSVRAVGTANGRNPISIIIPCHRVIGKNGNLTGYAGGIDCKIALLKIEGHLLF